MASKLKDINLLSAYNFTLKPPSKGIRLFFLILILEVSVLFLISSFYVTKYATIARENSLIQREIDNKQNILSDIEKFAQKKVLLSKKEKILEYIQNQNLRYLKTLEILEKIVPINITFDNLQLDINKITCSIRGDSYETVTQFVYNMKNSGYFDNISFNSIIVSNNIYSTTVTADIVGK